MTKREDPLLEVIDNGLREAKEADEIRDRRPVFSHPLGDVLLREREVLHELHVSEPLIDAVQILTLNVFNQGDFQGLSVRRLSDDNGDLFESGQFCGPKAALPCDQLITVRTLSDLFDRVERGIPGR